MQQIVIINNNSSLMWKTIKSILNKGHTKQIHLQDLQIEDGTLTKISKECADKTMHIVCVVGKTLARKISQPTVIPPSFQCNLNHYVFLQSTCLSETEDTINNLYSKKVIPLDNVPIEFIKISSSIFSIYLSDIFNNCISSGVYHNVSRLLRLPQFIKLVSMKSAQIINQYPCSLLSIKCLKDFFMKDYAVI